MDPTINEAAGEHPDADATDTNAEAPGAAATSRVGAYRSEPYVQTSEVPLIDVEALKVAAGIPTSGERSTRRRAKVADDADGARRGDDGGDDDIDGEKRPSFRRRHPKLTVAAIIVFILMIPVGITWVGAMTKEGHESFLARNAEWARDMKLGFLVDRAEQKYYERDQYADGGTPDAALLGTAPSTTGAPTGNNNESTTTKATIPHLAPPGKLASPVAETLPGEGDWTPIGPLVDGLPGVYTTKVRPNATKTSLLVFVSWIDPKLTNIRLLPGTDLPGGKWEAPNSITPEMCPKAIMASNGGFRMDQARGGYYAEGREPFKLRDGAASLVIKKNGEVDVAQWGRDYTAANLPEVESVRQNLELMVDNGQPVPGIDGKDWGALLPNSYFVWRSGYGVTKDGALVYAGGPAMTPLDLATTLINAGAVRAMEGDINPEWVFANIFTVGPDGTCSGTKALDATEDKGGMRQPANRYLTTDTRDFILVSAK